MKRYWPFLLIVLIGVGPFLLSWWLLRHPEWLPKERVHHGRLIQPPFPLDFAQITFLKGDPSKIQRRWLLLLPLARRCDQRCRRFLDEVGKIHRLLGKDMPRVQRVIALLEGEAPPQEAATVIRLDPRTKKGLEARLKQPLRPRSILLTDPLGQVILWYDPETDLLGLFRDLRRLLRYSKLR